MRGGDVESRRPRSASSTKSKREKRQARLPRLRMPASPAVCSRWSAIGEFVDSIFNTNVKGDSFLRFRSSASVRRRVHRSQCVDGWQQRPARMQRLRSDEGGDPLVRADVVLIPT